MRTAGVLGVLIEAARTAASSEVDQHLVPHQWDLVRPKCCHRAAGIQYQGILDSLCDSEGLEEGRFVRLVLIAGCIWIRTQHDPAYVVGVVRSPQPPVADRRSDSGE